MTKNDLTVTKTVQPDAKTVQHDTKTVQTRYKKPFNIWQFYTKHVVTFNIKMIDDITKTFQLMTKTDQSMTKTV